MGFSRLTRFIKMKSQTLIHQRVEAARKGENPTVICKVTSGWVVLGDNQKLKGYCLLLSDPVAGSLNELSPPGRAQFLRDMTNIGDALLEVFKPDKINYSILGNKDPVLHAHIHPRYADEEERFRTTVPFRYHFEKIPPIPFDAARDQDLMKRLRERILRKAK